MKEIKFRAWDEAKKEMIYSNHEGGLRQFFDYTDNPNPITNEIKFMEFTGLNDKNDKEIFEGDIIEGGYLNPITNEFHSKKFLIEYGKGGYIGRLIGYSPYGDTLLMFITGEVIGNTYETPELLK